MTEKLDINLDKLNEYETELIHYEGYLPMILQWSVGLDYLMNVLKTENGLKVIQQMEKVRDYTHEEFKEELINWCKENPEYSDILK